MAENIGYINLNVRKVAFKMSHKEEGIIFTPGSKGDIVVDKASIIDVPLDDYIKSKRKSATKTDDSKSLRRGKKALSRRKNRANKEPSKKSSRQEKRDSKKDSKTKQPAKKNIEIKKVDEATLREILNSIHVDSEGYSLRLVATKKK